ncbi:hypothetical protein CNY89_09935 [Amaricoccus sp. HAR-UPW-R2A-40]|nr:hypothetical protein CNY89_09935 [Amaricoccus sp. HAR-UPW-R2A-40]
MFFQTNNDPSVGFGWPFVPHSTGFEMRRSSILSSHSMSPGVPDHIDPIFHTCLWRRNSPTHYTSGNGATYPAPLNRTLNYSGTIPNSRVRMTNCVLPAGIANSGDYNPNLSVEVDVFRSNTAVPDGWAATDVALGKVGAYGYEN